MTETATPVTERLQIFNHLGEAFPDVDIETLAQIAAWIDTGVMPLSAAGIERAARSVAVQTSRSWGNVAERNAAYGIATQAIDAYFTSA